MFLKFNTETEVMYTKNLIRTRHHVIKKNFFFLRKKLNLSFYANLFFLFFFKKK